MPSAIAPLAQTIRSPLTPSATLPSSPPCTAPTVPAVAIVIVSPASAASLLSCLEPAPLTVPTLALPSPANVSEPPAPSLLPNTLALSMTVRLSFVTQPSASATVLLPPIVKGPPQKPHSLHPTTDNTPTP